MSKLERLAPYLSAAARRPFSWRDFHCGVFAADWIRLERGVDPMGALRDAVRSEADAVGVIDQAGGFVPLLRTLAVQADLFETDAPEPGDVGVVGGRGVWAAGIRGMTRWTAITPRGLISWRTAPVVAWRV